MPDLTIQYSDSDHSEMEIKSIGLTCGVPIFLRNPTNEAS
jgi:hypothetical protein